MMCLVRLLNPPSRTMRWCLKLVFVCAISLLVLYPKPWMLVAHVARAINLPELIQPDAPGIARLAHAAQQNAAATELRAVEQIVTRALPYEYDWTNWGVANYFPTVEETLARGRCDCKGRAVVAASILASLGYQPRLVSDLSHVWVWTPAGELMGPRKTASGRRLLDASARGNRIDLGAVASGSGFFVDLPARLGFSINVFPPVRTAGIALAVWIVMLRSRPRWVLARAGLGSMGSGLSLLGWSSPTPESAHLWAAWVGIGLILVGLLLAHARAARKAAQDKGPAAEAAGPCSR